MRGLMVIAVILAACGAPAAVTERSATATGSTAPAVAATSSFSLGSCLGNPQTGLASTAPVLPAIDGATRVTLFYGTHTHGHLIRPDGVTFAHVAGQVGALRAALPQPARSLFLGNGDDLDASLCGVDTGSRHVVDAFGAAGLDADTYGYNEVSPEISRITPDQLRAIVGASPFKWVSANVLEPDGADAFAAAQGARRFVIRDVGGVRVGLTGLVSLEPAPGFKVEAFRREMRALEPVAAMRELVPVMRKAGAQLVVVLSHMGIQDIERVARESEGVDVIVGNHCCEMSYLRTVGGTIITDGVDNMNQLGQLDLLLRDGRIVGHVFSVHAITTASPVDATVASVLERFVRPRR